MRRKLELALNLGPGTGSKLELDAQTTDPGQVTFVVEDLSASSGSASESGVGASARVGASAGACFAGTAKAVVRVTINGRAVVARNGV
jgi:hypothetical protein